MPVQGATKRSPKTRGLPHLFQCNTLKKARSDDKQAVFANPYPELTLIYVAIVIGALAYGCIQAMFSRAVKYHHNCLSHVKAA